MNNYIFTDNAGNKYKRIDKRQAARLFEAGGVVVLSACNKRPFGITLGPAPRLTKSDATPDFRRAVADFEYYNCCSEDAGYYCAFYAAI